MQADSPGSSSNSSYVPPDSIVGYKCDLSMCKLSRKDVPKPLLPVEGKTLATLIADAEEQAALHRLSPLDLERRLYLSCIFSATSLLINTDDDIAELPSTISQSILALKLAIQHKKLYVQPRPSTTFEELCLNNILFSTFTGHGKPSIKNNFNEIHLIANSLALFLAPFFTPHDPIQIEWDATSWIYNQLNNKAKDKKRPDINFHIQSGNTIVEVGCGEVMKDKTGEVEAKARVIEIMKR